MKPGQHIQQLRKARGMSLRALARKAGVSVAYLSKLERDESSPTVDLLDRIAVALEVETSALLAATPREERNHDLPPSLQTFIHEFSDRYPELSDPQWQRDLAQVRLRGQYPQEVDDWLEIYFSMRNILGRKR